MKNNIYISMVLSAALLFTGCTEFLGERRQEDSAQLPSTSDLNMKTGFSTPSLYEVSLDSSMIKSLKLTLDNASSHYALVLAPPFSAQLDVSSLSTGSHVIQAVIEIDVLGAVSRLERQITFVKNNSAGGDKILAAEGFESGSLGRWQDWGGAVSSNMAAKSGNYALRVGTATGGAGLDINNQVVPGKRYRLEAYGKNPQATVYAGFGIKVETSTKQILLERTVAIRSADFQLATLEFDMPTGATTAFVYIWKEAGTDYAYLDDVKVTEIGSVASPTPTPAPAPNPAPAPSPTPTPARRDPLKQPFAVTSIWNMPIGSNAIYKPANIPINNGFNLSKIDEERIILTPQAPLVPVYYNSVGWNGGDRCVAQGGQLAQVPIPTNYLIPNSGENESAAVLMPDGRTIIQMQPLTRCQSGGVATSLVVWGGVDIYGDGIPGAHGGSNLSAFGGSIRVGEMRPGQKGPAHAIKVIVEARNTLFRCTVRTDCYRWPASTSDGYSVGYYGSQNGNSNFAMRMGALLALPANLNVAALNLETEPARQLAFTLQNYGGYIVDDSYGDGFGFATEDGTGGSFRDQFRNDYGFDFVAKVGNATPWARDLEKIIRNLNVVDNNSKDSTGGGGTPRQPLADPF